MLPMYAYVRSYIHTYSIYVYVFAGITVNGTQRDLSAGVEEAKYENRKLFVAEC